ncbi:hypothetical protein BBK36DRAFT_1192783 [Trichoderma citrinoviride]|uniref:Uncharacterized protein n=1 Tax=Trichoderma citrinoviride TaxID=58853 RepID=A0A2T4BIA8_9HYPO|nr:hypothetical protein BBK36DRAFT_1192783 [Trichoderma citrinoviride]PTB69018.1 hypothetical protein BBK36DRAFT_1192783 [Trichoderma citrinoviride]
MALEDGLCSHCMRACQLATCHFHKEEAPYRKHIKMKWPVVLLGVLTSLAAGGPLVTPRDSTSGTDAEPQDVCHIECTVFYAYCRKKPYSYTCSRDGQYHYGRRNHRCEQQCWCQCEMGCRGGICATRD